MFLRGAPYLEENVGNLTSPHFPHGDLTDQPAAAEAVGKLETPSAFSKWAELTSFP